MIRLKATLMTWRFYFILSLICLAVLGLAWRIFNLTVLDQCFLCQQGDDRVLRQVSAPAFRGMIVDRNGFPLAVSTKVYSIWINPKEFAPEQKDLVRLSKLLEMPVETIQQLHKQKKSREFAYLKRSQSPEIARKIKKLLIPGVYTQEAYRRYYPEGESTAQVIGFTNVDDQGQEGLELAYNKWLAGEPGKKWVIRDRLGRIISDVRTISDQKPGHDLMISIDRRIQYLAFRELSEGLQNGHAESGSAVVLDAATGEILAMVNLPSFNPNNRLERSPQCVRNRAVTDVFEPGSTLKAFSVMTALDSGHFKPDTLIDTSPGWMVVGKNIVKDENNNGKLTPAQILQVSSNMGVTKMILGTPPNHLWDVLHRVGFGEITGIEFPGEQNGYLVRHEPCGSFTLATLAFGYGISVTALQLTRAYSVIANAGIKLPVSLLKQSKRSDGQQVLNAKIAHQMLELLETVVDKGTGKRAAVPGYRVAGKTGTSKIASGGVYQKDHHISSFIGIAPVSQPRLVVAVVMYDTQGKAYLGAQVAAPVFEKIMEGTLRMLDIPPDHA